MFVHGLNGDPYKTWAYEDDDETGFCWIQKVPSILQGARFMTFGYDASFADGGDNLMGVRQHAEALLLALKNKRAGLQVYYSDSYIPFALLSLCSPDAHLSLFATA